MVSYWGKSTPPKLYSVLSTIPAKTRNVSAVWIFTNITSRLRGVVVFIYIIMKMSTPSTCGIPWFTDLYYYPSTIPPPPNKKQRTDSALNSSQIVRLAISYNAPYCIRHYKLTIKIVDNGYLGEIGGLIFITPSLHYGVGMHGMHIEPTKYIYLCAVYSIMFWR